MSVKYKNQADNAVAIINNAIGKLSSIQTQGDTNAKSLSGRDDFLATEFEPLLSNAASDIPKIIESLESLKESIINRANELDREEEEKERERNNKKTTTTTTTTSTNYSPKSIFSLLK